MRHQLAETIAIIAAGWLWSLLCVLAGYRAGLADRSRPAHPKKAPPVQESSRLKPEA